MVRLRRLFIVSLACMKLILVFDDDAGVFSFELVGFSSDDNAFSGLVVVKSLSSEVLVTVILGSVALPLSLER